MQDNALLLIRSDLWHDLTNAHSDATSISAVQCFPIDFLSLWPGPILLTLQWSSHNPVKARKSAAGADSGRLGLLRLVLLLRLGSLVFLSSTQLGSSSSFLVLPFLQAGRLPTAHDLIDDTQFQRFGGAEEIVTLHHLLDFLDGFLVGRGFPFRCWRFSGAGSGGVSVAVGIGIQIGVPDSRSQMPQINPIQLPPHPQNLLRVYRHIRRRPKVPPTRLMQHNTAVRQREPLPWTSSRQQ
jgi:hypothetical protein